MRVGERDLARTKLDTEMRPFRGKVKGRSDTLDLLRSVRRVLGIPAGEMARELGVNRSVLFRLEQSEERRTISLKSMDRMAAIMGCTVVYGVVPRDGKTLTEMAERRKWMKRLGTRE